MGAITNRPPSMRRWRDLLATGPKASAEVEEAAKANGHSPATLRRARQRLGVCTQKSGPRGSWTMALPALDGTQPPKLE